MSQETDIATLLAIKVFLQSKERMTISAEKIKEMKLEMLLLLGKEQLLLL